MQDSSKRSVVKPAVSGLSAEFYASVGKDPVLLPLFSGKSLRCAIGEFAAFLIQFLEGDEEQTQHRWWLSLRGVARSFPDWPKVRSAWLKHIGATVEAAPLDRRRGKRYVNSSHSSAYVTGKESAGPDDSTLAALWAEQRVLDDAVAAIAAGHDQEALTLARQFVPRPAVP